MDGAPESITIPSQLPLLPLVNRVLLPTAFLRLVVSSKDARRWVAGQPSLGRLHAAASGGARCMRARPPHACSEAIPAPLARSVALMEHLSSASSKELLVACVPSLLPPAETKEGEVSQCIMRCAQ